MNWYYGENGKQVGPVSEEQLLELAQKDVVKPETLVWRAGMENWRAFRETGLAVPPPLVPAPEKAPETVAPAAAERRLCNSCGRLFETGNPAQFGEAAICPDCKPAWVQRFSQGIPAPGSYRYAGFWIRVVAQMIDGIITSTVPGVAYLVLFGSSWAALMKASAEAGARGTQPDPAAMAELMYPMMASIRTFQLLALVAGVAYSVYFLVKFGATPGKMAVGIQVIRADGGPVGIGLAIGRFFCAVAERTDPPCRLHDGRMGRAKARPA